MKAIEVHDLKKNYKIAKKEAGIVGSLKHLVSPRYEELPAVKGISFQIAQGESVAFLGANGAGKSTTIKMLTGIMTQLWWDIPVEETFRLLKKIYEIPEEQYIKNMEKFSNILGLREFMNQPARKLSLGQRVRADLAAALLHDPPILFLDEPTIGIDVAVKQKIYVFLKEINRERKTTILLTSHDMKDLESLCDRLIILEKGEILFDNKMNRLFEIYGESLSLEEIIIELFEHRRVS